MKTTISGSFRKHLNEIIKVIETFDDHSCMVLSPSHVAPKNPGEEFVLFHGEKTTDPKELETLHLEAIRKSDFLYVVDPDGYVGNSAVMEIGFALAIGKPIYVPYEPQEFILKLFIKVADPLKAIELTKNSPSIRLIIKG